MPVAAELSDNSRGRQVGKPDQPARKRHPSELASRAARLPIGAVFHRHADLLPRIRVQTPTREKKRLSVPTA